MMSSRLALGRVFGLNGPLFIVIGLTGMMMQIGKAPQPTTVLSAVQAFIALFMGLVGIVTTSGALLILSEEVVSLRKLLEAKAEEQIPVQR